jgi:arylsulfatase A-like enzyme
VSHSPNIVFVFCDQLRYGTLGCEGNTVCRTPNIDRFAGQGVVFDNAFSNCPICSPFRGNVLTGRYPHQHGVVDNEYELHHDETTLPQVLKDAGYATAFVGKWHLGYGPYTEDKRYGFDTMAANNCLHDYYKVAYHNNERGPIPIEKWAPEEETDLAIRWIEEQQDPSTGSGQGRPMFLMLGWGPPHWPYDEYPDEFKAYDPADIEVAPNVPKPLAPFARQEIADYYGNVAGLDAQFGRLMDTLDRLGLAEDTVVCFTSDHGDHLWAHGYGKPGDGWLHPTKRASKATPYEESCHIPFIARGPGVDAGRRSGAMISSVDMMPTLLGLLGRPIPDAVEGADVSHELTGGDGDEPDSVYLQNLGEGWPHRGEWVGFWRAVRTPRYTYARWHDDTQGPLLFDRKTDPHEMTNLAGNPDHAALEHNLRTRLGQWIADTADPFDTGDRDPRIGALKLGQTFTHDKWVQ